MATDGERAAALAQRLGDRSRGIIDAELRRLARRAPGLGAAEIVVADAALTELAESLLIARLRLLPERADQLATLFDVVDPAPSP
jgi:hypothetical protein